MVIPSVLVTCRNGNVAALVNHITHVDCLAPVIYFSDYYTSLSRTMGWEWKTMWIRGRHAQVLTSVDRPEISNKATYGSCWPLLRLAVIPHQLLTRSDFAFKLYLLANDRAESKGILSVFDLSNVIYMVDNGTTPVVWDLERLLAQNEAQILWYLVNKYSDQSCMYLTTCAIRYNSWLFYYLIHRCNNESIRDILTTCGVTGRLLFIKYVIGLHPDLSANTLDYPITIAASKGYLGIVKFICGAVNIKAHIVIEQAVESEMLHVLKFIITDPQRYDIAVSHAIKKGKLAALRYLLSLRIGTSNLAISYIVAHRGRKMP